ncbi:MAG: isochorismatase family protein [Acidimicrobiales bacterium]
MHVAGTAPYPWPYDGRLDGAHLALVLPGWDEVWAGRALDVDAARDGCGSLAFATAAAGGLVVAVTHQGATGLPLPVLGRTVTADGIDGFHGGPLDGILRREGRTHLLVAGIGLEGPVHSTLRSANDRGYECLLVTDAVAPLTTTLVEASAKTVTMSGGIFGAIGATAATLAALRGAAIPSLVKES